jgi:hypothetical protein
MRTILLLVPPLVVLAACAISTDENLWKKPRDSHAGEAADRAAGDLTPATEAVLVDGRTDRPSGLDGKRDLARLDGKLDTTLWPDTKLPPDFKLAPDTKLWPDTKLAPDKLAPDTVPPCTAGTFQCQAGNTARYCKTIGNWLSVGSCPLGCDAATKACRVPSNVATSLMGIGTKDFAPISGTVTINTDTGAISGVRAAGTGLDATSGIYYSQPSPTMGVFSMKKLTIPATVTLQATGSRALVLLADDAVTISGLINVTASQNLAGPGGQDGGGPGTSSSGSCGGKTAQGDNYGVLCSGGAGGGGNGGAGGAGGVSICASPHNYTAGAGGGVGGVATLIPLVGGCGGAGGTIAVGESTSAPGKGGGGGGALQISSAVSIGLFSGGGINAGGGGGGATVSGGGAGGGAGGSILLEAPSLSVGSGGVVAANGGGGGAGDCT